jgi:transglutaminase-like putative cysteine protease
MNAVAGNGREAAPGAKSAVDFFFEFALLGLLASGYLAVLGSGYLDAPTAIVTGTGLAVRALLVLRWIRLELSPRAVNLLTLGYVAFYPADYYLLSRDFLTATVHLVFFLAVVKILTAASERDYFYVKIIAFLELLAASILSASANFFLFLALFLLFGVATFAASEIRRAALRSDTVVRTARRHFGTRLAALTLFTVFGILLITGGFFFLLPRTARAALQRFVPERYHIAGFSNEVALGQIGELQMRNTAVMHIRMLQDTPPLSVKWRGAALTTFDGKRWFNKVNTAEVLRVEPSGLLRLATLQQQLTPGKRIGYQVAMQESASDALFFAGTPEALYINVPMIIRTPSNSFRLGFGPPDRLRYSAYSVINWSAVPSYVSQPLSDAERAANLQLPALDPRIRDLAIGIASGAQDDGARARAVEKYLSKTYPYTIELPKTEVADPVADFLFSRKKGHCEYFASSMVVMLRSIGIPARVVTGFQSGIFNPISGWYLIRASDAHSWVEAWIPGSGWTTFDPTPPNTNPTVSFATRLHLYLDALQVFWQDWILSYDIDRQLNLVGNLEQSRHHFALKYLDGAWSRIVRKARIQAVEVKKHAGELVAAVAAAALLIFLGPVVFARIRLLLQFRRVQRGEVSASDATLLYQRMLLILRRRGVQKPAWLTPAEFSQLVPDAATARLVADFTSAYHELRYGRKQDAARRLVAILDQLENSPVRAK